MRTNTKDPSKSVTIEEFISFKNDDIISYNNISFRENILDDYISELMELVVEVELSEKERRKYIYKPKVLAKDIYENSELDFLILRINGICNMKEFDLNNRKVKLIKTADLDSFLTSIYNANKNDIDIYNSTYNIY